jgi:hypothetical protein
VNERQEDMRRSEFALETASEAFQSPEFKLVGRPKPHILGYYTFLLVYAIGTKGSHCDISVHTYNIL